MNELHCHGTFAYTGSHSLHRAVTYIADRKDSGDTALQQKRVALERPALWRLAIFHHVRTGQNESPVIAFHNTGQPFRARQRSDEDEHRARRNAFYLVRVRAKHRNFFQMVLAMNIHYAGVGP